MIKHDVMLTSSSSSPPPADCQLQTTQSNMDASSVDILDEIIELILLKCPVKSVIRFKSVSKSWQSIISHRRFFRSLQSRLSENREHKFIVFVRAPSGRCKWKDNLCLVIVLEDGRCRAEAVMGRYPFTSVPTPICSCNGLILLHGPSYKEISLWNPLTRKHIIIPPPSALTYLVDLPCHLYYDSVAEDYRIVVAHQDWYVVYSCKSGSWGETQQFCPSDATRNLNRAIISFGVFVDGCVYTMHSGGIICLDARDGRLHNFPRPEGVEGLSGLQLNEVSGRLCLYGFSGDDEKRLLQLWVMEEKNKYCWRKLISMEEEAGPFLRNCHPVCFTNEDDVVLRASALDNGIGGRGRGRDNGIGGRGGGRGHSSQTKHFLYKYNSSRNRCKFQDLIAWDYNFIRYFPYSENLLMPGVHRSDRL